MVAERLTMHAYLAGFKSGFNLPTGTPTCTIWHQNQPLSVAAFGCACLGVGEMQTLTAHASVDTSCDDTCAAGELASGVGLKTDTAKSLWACVPQSDVSGENRYAPPCMASATP